MSISNCGSDEKHPPPHCSLDDPKIKSSLCNWRADEMYFWTNSSFEAIEWFFFNPFIINPHSLLNLYFYALLYLLELGK